MVGGFTRMTYYEEIENYLENINSKQDIKVTIDDIDAESITFSVYDCEVTEESMDTIYETLHYANNKDLEKLTDITHHPSKNGSAECFNLRFELDIGEDEESEEELRQKAEDYAEDQAFERYREQKRGIY